MLPEGESRFQVGRVEGQWNVGWRKERGICDERNSVEMLPEFQQTQLLSPWISIFLFFSNCSLRYMVHHNMNVIEENRARSFFVYIPHSTYQIAEDLWLFCNAMSIEMGGMWVCMVMHWPRVVLRIILSLLGDWISFYFSISVPNLTEVFTVANFMFIAPFPFVSVATPGPLSWHLTYWSLIQEIYCLNKCNYGFLLHVVGLHSVLSSLGFRGLC